MAASNISQVFQSFINSKSNPRKNLIPKINLNSPNFQLNNTSNITYNLANNWKDRLAAYQLMYKIYVEKEFTQPNESKIWCSHYDAHPKTLTFVAKENNVVVGTISVIPDSDEGLPSDELYQEENDKLRKQNAKLSEIVSLGISKHIRGPQEILISLFNLAYLGAKAIQETTDFIITVNPRHTIFYKKKLKFEELGVQKEYNKVGGAPANLLNLNFAKVEAFVDTIRSSDTEKNSIYHHFLKSTDDLSLTHKIKEKHKPISLHEVDELCSMLNDESKLDKYLSVYLKYNLNQSEIDLVMI